MLYFLLLKRYLVDGHPSPIMAHHLVFLFDALYSNEFYECSRNARRVLWKLARETHAPEDWVLRETNMATDQTGNVWHVCS